MWAKDFGYCFHYLFAMMASPPSWCLTCRKGAIAVLWEEVLISAVTHGHSVQTGFTSPLGRRHTIHRRQRFHATSPGLMAMVRTESVLHSPSWLMPASCKCIASAWRGSCWLLVVLYGKVSVWARVCPDTLRTWAIYTISPWMFERTYFVSFVVYVLKLQTVAISV